MEKVFEKSTKDQLNPHKGLKFLLALGMVLPVFMGSVQSVFADGHHCIHVIIFQALFRLSKTLLVDVKDKSQVFTVFMVDFGMTDIKVFTVRSMVKKCDFTVLNLKR